MTRKKENLMKQQTVTIKVGKLANASQALIMLMNTPLPPPLALRLSRLSRAADVELVEYNRQRDLLVKQYGETKDGVSYTFPERSKREECQRQIDLLGEEEVTLPAVTVKASELGNRELPASLYSLLDWIFPETQEDSEDAEENKHTD
jgi:hypothetical protein